MKHNHAWVTVNCETFCIKCFYEACAFEKGRPCKPEICGGCYERHENCAEYPDCLIYRWMKKYFIHVATETEIRALDKSTPG